MLFQTKLAQIEPKKLASSDRNTWHYSNRNIQRKSFDGLCRLVISAMQRQPTSCEVFVFLNRNRTHIKFLHGEHRGFVLYYKRLEQGAFGTSSLKKGELSWSDLVLLIEGVQIVKSIQKQSSISERCFVHPNS